MQVDALSWSSGYEPPTIRLRKNERRIQGKQIRALTWQLLSYASLLISSGLRFHICPKGKIVTMVFDCQDHTIASRVTQNILLFSLGLFLLGRKDVPSKGRWCDRGDLGSVTAERILFLSMRKLCIPQEIAWLQNLSFLLCNIRL